MEPVLLLPSAMTQPMLAALVSASCVARHWHYGGRYGSRIARRQGDTSFCTIPVLRSATARIAAALKDRNPGAGADGAPLPNELVALLRSGGDISLRYQPVTQPRVPRAEFFDATVHPERSPPGFRLAEALASAAVCTSSSTGDSAFTFAELFAGIGGFALGLEALGGSCVFASEVAPESVAVYQRNFPAFPAVQGDIWKVPDQAIPPHDLLVAGFPCQPFSAMGAQPGLSDTKGVHETENRGMLFTQIVRVLRVAQPAAFILENVPGLLYAQNGRALATIRTALGEAGYTVSYEVIDARCLTAQRRKRL